MGRRLCWAAGGTHEVGSARGCSTAVDRLRSAYLHRNGVAVHRWPEDDRQGGR
jgi:hypothetical protein